MKKLLIFILLISTVLQAKEKGNLSLSFGTVNGKAGEYVYYPEIDRKISYLEWDIKNVPVVILDYKYSPAEYLEFEFNFKKNLETTRSAVMQDYDWNLEDGKLSNYSKNNNYVKNLFSIDLNAKYLILNNKNFKSGPMIGFNYDLYDFYGKNGTQYNYGENVDSPVYPGDNSIKSVIYKQRFLTPYLGYTAIYRWNKTIFNLEAKGSLFTRAKAEDRHLERGPMKATESYRSIKTLGLKLGAEYPLTESLTLNGALEYKKYYKNKKSKVDMVYDDGTIENNIKDLGGIKNSNYTISMGISYKF